MKQKLIFVIFLILICIIFSQAQTVQSKNESSNLTAKQWREDLHFLSSELVKRHPNPFHAVSKNEFENAVKTLDAKLNKLSPPQIILEMVKIVALINEGHTRLNLPRESQWKFGRFPVRFFLYRNGLFIQEIAKERKEVVGWRVTKIEDTPIEQVIKQVSPFVHHDNEMTKKLLLPLFISTPEVLHFLGIIKDTDNLPITVEEDNGKQVKIQLKTASQNSAIEWIKANNSATTNLPLWQKKTNDNYWFEYLENLKTVYVQFNSVSDKKDESIAQFSERLYNFIKDNQVEKLILDLRLNDGGNSRLAMPLLYTIIKSDKINQKGKFFTIIGRATFSAAMVFTVELEKHTNTIFVGEPTGGSPNQYGEMLSFNLPNSGLLVNYAAYYFQTAGPFDNRPWLAPTIATEPTIESFRQNQDLAFEATVSYSLPRLLSTQMKEAYASGGISNVLLAYQKYKTNPSNFYLDTEREVRSIGNQLQEMKKLDDAINVFKLNVEAYPERAAPIISLAEIYLEKGDKAKAKELYLKGLSLLESDKSINKGFMERLRSIANERLANL